MLKVEDLKFLGQGKDKAVYNHPTDENKVIKVMKRNRATPTGTKLNQNKLRGDRQQGIYREFRREIIHYLQLCKNTYGQNIFTFPVETIHGFQATDQGLALVAEKIIGPSGQAETAHDLADTGKFEDKHRKALDQFFDECSEYHVLFREVNLRGLMYTESPQDRPEFVIVDTIGEKNIIPSRSISKKRNDKNIRKMEARLKEQLEELIKSNS